MQTEHVCQHCGKTFAIISNTRGRFCSRACYHAYRATNPGAYRKHPLVTLTCPVCGKTFERRQHEIRSTAQYCSRKCAGTVNGHTNATPATRRQPVTKTCDECGQAFVVPYKDSLRRRFCGKACYLAHRSKNIVGERNPNYRHGRNRRSAYLTAAREYPQHCAICGFDIAVQVHHIIPLATGGRNNVENLVVLCPNHHAMAELGLLSQNELAEYAKHHLARGRPA